LALIAVLFSAFAAAQAVPLVQMTANLDLQDAIPGYNYSRSATVEWTVPDSMIQGLDGQTVAVYVKLSAKPDSWVYFSDGKQESAFELDCVVAEGACGEGSKLSRTVPLTLRVPLQMPETHEEGLEWNASFTPFSTASPTVLPSVAATPSESQPPAAGGDMPDFTGFATMIFNPASLLSILFVALVVTAFIHLRK